MRAAGAQRPPARRGAGAGGLTEQSSKGYSEAPTAIFTRPSRYSCFTVTVVPESAS